VAKARLEALPGAVPKKKAGGKKKDAAAADEAAAAGFEVLATFKGAQLVSEGERVQGASRKGSSGLGDCGEHRSTHGSCCGLL